MKVTKKQLKRIIKEERSRLLKEQWGQVDSGSPLIDFAQAWAGLGGVVQDQVSAIIAAYHNSGGVGDQRFNEAVYDRTPALLTWPWPDWVMFLDTGISARRAMRFCWR